MSLTPEDGSIVADANTYATVADLKTFAQLRGVCIPNADVDAEKLLIKAMDYLESARQVNRYQGSRVSASQSLAWPRSGVVIENLTLASDEIPRALKYAQLQLALDAQDTDLMPNRESNASGPISSETVGPLSISYDNSQPKGFLPGFAKADAQLSLLFKRGGLTGVR